MWRLFAKAANDYAAGTKRVWGQDTIKMHIQTKGGKLAVDALRTDKT